MNDFDDSEARALSLMTMLLALGAFLLGLALGSVAHSREGGDWSQLPPGYHEWFSTVTRPDVFGLDEDTGQRVQMSCCGEADAYETDEYELVDGEIYAIITEGYEGYRPTVPYCDDSQRRAGSCKPFRAPGTRIRIPPEKLQFKPPNITGHGWVFIGSAVENPFVYCWCPPAGL